MARPDQWTRHKESLDMHLYHYLYSQGVLKRQNGRAPGVLTVNVVSCRDGLYLMIAAKQYVKVLAIEHGNNLLPLIAKHSFTTLRVLSVSVHAMSGDHQAIADQTAQFYFTQEQE
jgi:hypothetical protein